MFFVGLEEAVARATLTPRHLRALASLPNKDQEEITRSVIGQGLTVRDVEEEVRKRKEKLEKQMHFIRIRILSREDHAECPR